MIKKEAEESWSKAWLELIEKWAQYGKFVWSEIVPNSSKGKQDELKHLIDKLKHPVREKWAIPRSAGYNNLYNTKGKSPWRKVPSLSSYKRLLNPDPHSEIEIEDGVKSHS